MQVKELIDRLKKIDPAAHVDIGDAEIDEYWRIQEYVDVTFSERKCPDEEEWSVCIVEMQYLWATAKVFDVGKSVVQKPFNYRDWNTGENKKGLMQYRVSRVGTMYKVLTISDHECG